MNIHKLCKNQQEYLDLVWDYLRWILDPHISVWKEEDRPKLKPFFDWEAKRQIGKKETFEPFMPEEVRKSFDHYMKCREEYSVKEFEKRDAVANINDYDLFEAFLLDYSSVVNDSNDDLETDDPVEDVLNGEITRETLNKAKFLPDVNLSFPLIVAGYVNSDWDRVGKTAALVIDIVEKKEFDGE